MKKGHICGQHKNTDFFPKTFTIKIYIASSITRTLDRQTGQAVNQSLFCFILLRNGLLV